MERERNGVTKGYIFKCTCMYVVYPHHEFPIPSFLTLSLSRCSLSIFIFILFLYTNSSFMSRTTTILPVVSRKSSERKNCFACRKISRNVIVKIDRTVIDSVEIYTKVYFWCKFVVLKNCRPQGLILSTHLIDC